MPKLYTGPKVSQHSNPNNSVPPGHRSKCRKCGAVDKVAYKGTNRRMARCAYCGGTIARRRAPRQPKILSYVVLLRHDGIDLAPVRRPDRFGAESVAIAFAERGPVARTRIAQVVELLDGIRTGNVRVLRYDNYRGRRASIEWTSGCETCKGKGLVPVRIPAPSLDDNSTIKFLGCTDCNALGGQLTREVNYKKLRSAS